jgi:hypothetical protein
VSYEENDFEEPLENDDMYAAFGEGFEEDFDAQSEQAYEKAFDTALSKPADGSEAEDFFEDDTKVNEDDFEFDSVVGGRDKKPIMSMLNKGKLSKYEMDDLLNQL